MSKPSVSLVLIDSISSFYWHDRIYRADNWFKTEQYYNKIFKFLIEHIKRYKLALVCTKQNLFSSRPNISLEENRTKDSSSYDYMGKEWSNSINTKINIQQFCDISKFPALAKDKTLYKIEICETSTTSYLISYDNNGINFYDI